MNSVKNLTGIIGHTEGYHWGKIGPDSFFYNFLHNPSPNKPYAELWYGTHKK